MEISQLTEEHIKNWLKSDLKDLTYRIMASALGTKLPKTAIQAACRVVAKLPIDGEVKVKDVIDNLIDEEVKALLPSIMEEVKKMKAEAAQSGT